MALALMLVVFFTVLVVATALAPRILGRRVNAFDQSQLDDALRGIPRGLSPAVPVAAAAISAVVAGTSFALDGSAWPMWTLVVVVALVDVRVQRWSRHRVERLLRNAGAMPPGDAALEHDEQQRRWSTAGTVTFTLGTCCQVLARFEPLFWLIFPGAVLILVALVLVVVSGWKLLRGPDPEPIVLWHRDG
ncbi:hypothetical protein ASF38_04640 [Aeromicrobium sp. Leaf272]|nr:hypothetical protein ASF38_04640 [Aeromicrobium sp. Leaf272]